MFSAFLLLFSKLSLMWCYSMHVLVVEFYWGFFLFDFSAVIIQYFLP